MRNAYIFRKHGWISQCKSQTLMFTVTVWKGHGHKGDYLCGSVMHWPMWALPFFLLVIFLFDLAAWEHTTAENPKNEDRNTVIPLWVHYVVTVVLWQICAIIIILVLWSAVFSYLPLRRLVTVVWWQTGAVTAIIALWPAIFFLPPFEETCNVNTSGFFYMSAKQSIS